MHIEENTQGEHTLTSEVNHTENDNKQYSDALQAAEDMLAPAHQTQSEPEVVADATVEPEAPTRAPDPRADALERKAQRAEQEALAESGASAEPAQETQAPEHGTQSPEAAEAVPQAVVPEGFTQNEQGEFVTTIRVNGQDKTMTVAELQAAAQKVQSADQKYQDAARLRAEAESMNPPPKGEDQGLPTGGQPVVTAETIDQAVFSDADQGQQARELIAQRLNSPVPPSPIDTVDATIAEMERRQAIAEIGADAINAQIINDPEQAAVADQFSATLLRLNPAMSAAENLSRSFEMARSHLGLAPMIPPGNGESEINDRAARKAAHAQANATPASVRPPMVSEPAPYNIQHELNQMRKQRA